VKEGVRNPLLARHQRQDGVERHGLLVLVEDLNRPFHHAGRFSSALRCFFSVLRFGQAHLNGIARFNRLDKAQVFHAVVGDNRPDARINKQPAAAEIRK
jgi:hypothetical protein